MPEFRLPPLQPYFPTTFLERGVAVPFTTPQIFGCRTRPGRDAGLEIVVPNPSGGRGVYVFDLAGVRDYCHPTVHDRRLIQRIAELRTITPAAIRRESLAVAADGMAGEAAMAAALASLSAEREALLIGNFTLLAALVEQVEPSDRSAFTASAEMEERARRAVARLAGRMGRSPEWVGNSLEELSGVLRTVGMRTLRDRAPARQALRSLQAMHDGIEAWCARNPHSDLAGHAAMIIAVARLTLSLTTTMLERVDALTDDTIALLDLWASDPDQVSRTASRPDWMLDGWGPIAQLWHDAGHEAARRAAIAEIAVLVPVLPREVADWAGQPVDIETLHRLRRRVTLNQDWRTGAIVFAQIARNERLRAEA